MIDDAGYLEVRGGNTMGNIVDKIIANLKERQELAKRLRNGEGNTGELKQAKDVVTVVKGEDVAGYL